MRKYVVELIGTFFLVLTVGTTGQCRVGGRTAGHRGGPDGDDLRRGPRLGWALQPGPVVRAISLNATRWLAVTGACSTGASCGRARCAATVDAQGALG